MGWDKIKQMLNESKKQGDALANLIHEIDLQKNEVKVLLTDQEEDQFEQM